MSCSITASRVAVLCIDVPPDPALTTSARRAYYSVTKVASTVVAVSVLLATLAGTAGATPKKWYWTEAHAEAVAMKKVRVSLCLINPAEPICSDPARPHKGSLAPTTIQCQGRDERGATFTYSRFGCRFKISYISRQSGQEVMVGTGTVAVYPTGAQTVRWKLILFSSALA